MVSKPPEQQFILKNLPVPTVNLEKAKEALVTREVKKMHKLMGFTLKSPKINIIQYGFMETGIDRYWVIYSVDRESAQRIQDQRRGITGRMKEMNRKMFEDRDDEYIELKKYRGIQFEAIVKTMRRAARYLAVENPADDGCLVNVAKGEIQILFDEKPNEKITIRDLIRDHRRLFDKAVKTLSQTARRSLNEIVEDVEREILEKKERIEEDESVEEVFPEEGYPQYQESMLVNSIYEGS